MIWVLALVALAIVLAIAEEKAPIFFLKRLCGLAQIVDGVVMFFTGKSAGLNLRVAKRIARIRGDRMMQQSRADRQARIDGMLERWNKEGM